MLSLGLLHTPALWIVLVRGAMHNKAAKPGLNGSQSFLTETCSALNLNLLFPEHLFHLPCLWVTQGIISFCKSELSGVLSMQQWQKAHLPWTLHCLSFFCATYPRCWDIIRQDQQLFFCMCSCFGTGCISSSQALSSLLWCFNPDHSSVCISNGINPNGADRS